MNFKNIFRMPNVLTIGVVMVSAAMGLTSCNDDDDKFSGEPFFQIEGAEDGVVHMSVSGLDKGSWAFGVGDHYVVRANGSWKIVPVEGEIPEWMKIFPTEGEDDGILRFYAEANPMAQIRTVEFNVFVNGVQMPQGISFQQDPSGPTMTLSADIIQLQQKGNYAEVLVTSNYDWTVEDDPTAPWLKVTRDDNQLTIGTDEENQSGGERSGVITIRGTGSNNDIVKFITVTQLDAIFFDDFGWLYTPGDTSPMSYVDNSFRIDKWTDPDVLANNPGWTSVGDTNCWPLIYSRYHFMFFGSSAGVGNVSAPAVPSIEGAIKARVSFCMAGHCSKKNVRDAGNEFWVLVLGPGRIVEASSNGKSTSEVVSGQYSIPYNSTGDTNKHDIDLTEAAKFTLGSDAYFTTADPTGLEVWKCEESQYSVVVEGMTAETRMVIIGGEANLATMLNKNWCHPDGKLSRMCLDNFKISLAE